MSAQKSSKQAPTSALNLSLKHFLASGTYSDLTLVCGGKEFYVHKIILDAQSPVFHKLLNGSFKEAGKSRVEVHDDPEAFEVLVHYLYNFTLPESTSSDSRSKPAFAVRLYAIADKYNVEPLRDMAAQRLRKTIDVRAVPAFVEAVRMVDELTPPTDKTLWKIVLPLMTGNITFLLGDQDFRDLLQDMPQLMYELLAHLDSGYSERSEAVNLQSQFQTGSMTGSIPFPRPRAALSEDEADSLDDGDDLSHFPGYHGTFGAGRRLG
ncbi:hypothetical protein KC343_g7734 [Hortaea werneckii]|uniref:BTB domain-containing protein n=1 Tax=Hortaea werneckii TaxID=91943 RepID=A0A3M7GL12_HORWE|nr:hypothetical protein KC352_g15161 [Hortaea werneckii]KAI7563307.1 hypothetical protein KC317_g7820 [Hortaea werneckii]KAI7613236.1 hypothetical protein KC346_g7421 [Hortaea werneckii]KAI7622185.1 hypothetical protein KC343_g7734 [Hortaea werneckii]KAI7664221.1 hypothetical protein KC319_g7547 [Hortaea werneckii]